VPSERAGETDDGHGRRVPLGERGQTDRVHRQG
jgi:hypothetical protein